MPIPNHCIDCDKVAVVIEDNVPYCAKCYLHNLKGEPTTADEFNKQLDRTRESKK